jgi:hypothetical protein
MNRRSFLRTLAGATAAFTILPPATTYSRVWRATSQQRIIVPYWYQTEVFTRCYDDTYLESMQLTYIENPNHPIFQRT